MRMWFKDWGQKFIFQATEVAWRKIWKLATIPRFWGTHSHQESQESPHSINMSLCKISDRIYRACAPHLCAPCSSHSWAQWEKEGPEYIKSKEEQEEMSIDKVFKHPHEPSKQTEWVWGQMTSRRCCFGDFMSCTEHTWSSWHRFQ